MDGIRSDSLDHIYTRGKHLPEHAWKPNGVLPGWSHINLEMLNRGNRTFIRDWGGKMPVKLADKIECWTSGVSRLFIWYLWSKVWILKYRFCYFPWMALTSALKNVGATTWLTAPSESKPPGRPLLRCCSCFTPVPHLLPLWNINLRTLLRKSQAQMKGDPFKWISSAHISCI